MVVRCLIFHGFDLKICFNLQVLTGKSTPEWFSLEQVMFACGKYNLVHEFFRKLQKSSIPNALTYKGIILSFLLFVCMLSYVV